MTVPAPWDAPPCAREQHWARAYDFGKPLVGLRFENLARRGGPSRPAAAARDLPSPSATDPCPARFYECTVKAPPPAHR